MEILNFRVRNFSILKADFLYAKGIILNSITLVKPLKT